MNPQQLKNIIEAALLAADHPLSVDQLAALFIAQSIEDESPTRDELRQALAALQQECESRGIELKEVSSGYRFQVKQALAPWISRLWEERAPRYSRALLETLALIAYRQPITRAEIEDIRGVAVSSNIIKTLQEREWIRVLGHREVPGRPALYGTTREFLDFFSLKGLGDLPTLAEISSLDDVPTQMHLNQSELNPMPDNNENPTSNIVQLYPVANDTGADTNEASAQVRKQGQSDCKKYWPMPVTAHAAKLKSGSRTDALRLITCLPNSVIVSRRKITSPLMAARYKATVWRHPSARCWCITNPKARYAHALTRKAASPFLTSCLNCVTRAGLR